MDLFLKYIKPLFISDRFYKAVLLCIALFVVTFFFPQFFLLAQILFLFFIVLFLVDYVVLFFFSKKPSAKRLLSDRMSNGDKNSVKLNIRNNNFFTVNVRIIDEFPEQLQVRDFVVYRKLMPNQKQTVQYSILPLERGAYTFGNLNVFMETGLGFVVRHYVVELENSVRVYPSFVNLRNQQLIAKSTIHEGHGQRRMRRIGQSMEFEQIKEYVSGDDIRTINWKATARKGGLMVNNFMEEQSQQVYAIIDKGRLMRMPFQGMKLLDYAINSTLALANICLQKADKFGMMSFSNQIGTVVAADRKPIQRELIMQTLYNEETSYLESDFEMLYTQIRQKIKQRSLLILFTNFESMSGLKRQLNYLRSIAKHHLLLVVFFENTELSKLATAEVHTREDIYVKTIAEKYAFEKKLLVKELQQYGILSVLSRPENLTVATLNKYIELKAAQAV